MGEKFQNRYRIESNRMPGWNYAGEGSYFITLVTQHRDCCLGDIVKQDGWKKMVLSDFGEIVRSEWEQSFPLRDELFLDEYIIMPNHLHAIIILKKTGDYPVQTHGRASVRANATNRANGTNHANGTKRANGPNRPNQPFTRKSKSISSFVGGFKSAVNSKIDDYIDDHHWDIPKYNRNNHFFQANYHDHIIRNQNEYYSIKNYIINNPAKWDDDLFNPTNMK